MSERWYDCGKEPEEIKGVVMRNGGLMYIMKFKGQEETELVLSTEVKERLPHMIIKFYENRVDMSAWIGIKHWERCLNSSTG